MKFLGLDYGTKRIGLSVSDENNRLAFPKEIVPNDANLFKRLGEIVMKEQIGEFVVGESVDFSGKLNALSARIDIFILALQEKFKLPVRKQKEFLTSVEARRYENVGGQTRKASHSSHLPAGKKGLTLSQTHSKVKQIKSGRVDASAAALILQRYLDKINK